MDDLEIIDNLNPHPLNKLMTTCSMYMYPSNSHPGKIDFNLSDFEYNQPNNNLHRILTPLYEDIYLTARSMGLTRRMPALYYPKSLIRKYADKSGLSEYILKCEQHHRKINHDELAANYFGSYKKWMDGLNTFLDSQAIENKY